MRTGSAIPPLLLCLRSAAVAGMVLLTGLGCGKRSAELAPEPGAEDEAEDRFVAIWPQGAVVPVEIQNRHSNDLTIYVIENGKSQRVGMAIAAKSTYLRLPVHHLGPGNSLTLMAHAIGMARRMQSDRMTVMPGQRVVWTIENGFRHASAAVWD